MARTLSTFNTFPHSKKAQSLRSIAQDLLLKAGILIDGNRPWDIRIHDDRFYHRVLGQGALGLGEAYMDGWWDCDQLDAFFYRVLRAKLYESITYRDHFIPLLKGWLFNLQNGRRAFEIGERHYDLGNDLFEAMLDSRMVYSCGYWRHATTVDQAQEAKLDLICRKLYLEPGMSLLDIGCGWGSLVRFAAERYGVKAVGVTVSHEQAQLARERCRDLPVEIRVQDYRDVNEPFDRIVSVGMFEHVGHKNYETYFEAVRKMLKEDGLTLLHSIGKNYARHAGECDPWIEKYIFPNSELPTMGQICEAACKRFVMEDWHNFGPDYDKTLMAWYNNFTAAWPHLQQRYDDRFYRMWAYYLLSCAGLFRAREAQLWQVVFSKDGLVGGYTPVR